MRLYGVVAALSASLAIVPVAAAQEVRVSTSGSGGVVSFTNANTPPISDELIRRLVSDNLASQMTESADAYRVVLVVDAYDRFVFGKANKATVITNAGTGATSFVVGDTIGGGAAAGVVSFTRSGSGDVSVTSGSVIMSRTESGSQSGVFGSGYAADQVAAMGMRRFDSGVVANFPVTVTILKLK